MADLERIAQSIQNLADAVEYQTNSFDTRSDFNGFTITDSMGVIADSMFRIADVLENKNKEEG